MDPERTLPALGEANASSKVGGQSQSQTRLASSRTEPLRYGGTTGARVPGGFSHTAPEVVGQQRVFQDPLPVHYPTNVHQRSPNTPCVTLAALQITEHTPLWSCSATALESPPKEEHGPMD